MFSFHRLSNLHVPIQSQDVWYNESECPLDCKSNDRSNLHLSYGSLCSLRGQIKRVANSTYIITPYNVDVMGDLIDELENNGMFM